MAPDLAGQRSGVSSPKQAQGLHDAPITRGIQLAKRRRAHSETTRRQAAHSKTTGGRAPWEHPVENSRRGGRALENIDGKNTGRVAREQAVFSTSTQPVS